MANKKYIKDRQSIINTCEEFAEYWPLTLRQIYYQLVSKGSIPNSRASYNALSRECSDMRIYGEQSWCSMEDRSRKTSDKRGFSSLESFVETELQNAFDGYEKCLLTGQKKNVEIWLEKDALSKIVIGASRAYCVRVNTDRGFASTSFAKAYVDRANEAIGNGLTPVVLYLSDFDPSGLSMMESLRSKVKKIAGNMVEHIEFKRIGLTREQIHENDLPICFDALKLKDPRAKKHLKEHGELSVELDALHPKKLEQIVRAALCEALDVEMMIAEQEHEKKERNFLAGLRGYVKKCVHGYCAGSNDFNLELDYA